MKPSKIGHCTQSLLKEISPRLVFCFGPDSYDSKAISRLLLSGPRVKNRPGIVDALSGCCWQWGERRTLLVDVDVN